MSRSKPAPPPAWGQDFQVEANPRLSYCAIMSSATPALTEADILEQVIMSDHAGMSPESARAILDLRFDPRAVSRMNELAEKNPAGTLTDAERQEMEKYLRVGNFLNLMHAKARLAVADPSRRAST
jgi:hypothetical protein